VWVWIDATSCKRTGFGLSWKAFSRPSLSTFMKTSLFVHTRQSREGMHLFRERCCGSVDVSALPRSCFVFVFVSVTSHPWVMSDTMGLDFDYCVHCTYINEHA
jgi:hypothetical protein